MMTKYAIQSLALTAGFKLKQQQNGSMDLNPYVYEFAAALEVAINNELKAQVVEFRKELEQSASDAVLYGKLLAATRINALLAATPAQCLSVIKAHSAKSAIHALFEPGNCHQYENGAGDALIECGDALKFAEQYADKIIQQNEVSVHPDDIAVDRFADAMKAKLAVARAKGRSGWEDKVKCSGEHLANLLVEHLSKGNAGTFEDIANFAMMLHQRGDDPDLLHLALDKKFSTMCVSTQWLTERKLAEKANAFKDGFIEGYEQCSADEESGDWTDNSEQLDQYAFRFAETYANKVRQQR